jgi:hypothetical protein
MPIFWDSTYLAKWSNFVTALGHRYDNNQTIHSVGITGGGVLGGTKIIPSLGHDRSDAAGLEETLRKDFALSQRQIVQNWKYIADLFLKAFPSTRLAFDIDPPTANRSGQDSLDEISDYLVYRYGERVYLTRQDITDSKHGFDQYRILLKFRTDTLTGYELSQDFPKEDVQKLVKNALDDGVSFVEIPSAMFAKEDTAVQTALDDLDEHLGYQLVAQHLSIPNGIKSGEPVKAQFTFANFGDAAPQRPNQQLEKGLASSYQVALELRDQDNQPVVVSVLTPPIPTTQWLPGKPISWENEFRMPKLKEGTYSAWISIINKDTKRRLEILDATKGDPQQPATAIAAGSLSVSQ